MGAAHTGEPGHFHWPVHVLHDFEYIPLILLLPNDVFQSDGQCRSSSVASLKGCMKDLQTSRRGDAHFMPSSCKSLLPATILFWALVRTFDPRKRSGSTCLFVITNGPSRSWHRQKSAASTLDQAIHLIWFWRVRGTLKTQPAHFQHPVRTLATLNGWAEAGVQRCAATGGIVCA